MPTSFTTGYDVIIIGGGPAGSTLGFRLLSLGLSVALIDERYFPRPKLCGGMLTNRSRALYEQIYGCSMEPQIAARTARLEFFLGQRKISELDRLELEFVHRYEFDHFLLRKFTEAGGKLYEGERITPKNIQPHTVTLNSGKPLRYRVLAGADGAWSQIRKLIDPQFRPVGFCLEQELQSTAFQPGDPAAIYFNLVGNGYVWRFPNGAGSRIVGIGGEAGCREEIRQSFADFVADYPAEAQALPAGGAFLPAGRYVKPACSDELDLLLVGDAAGLVNAITGEGLYYAAASGLLAAAAIGETLRGQGRLTDTYLPRVRLIQRHIDWQNRINRCWRHAAFRSAYFHTLGRWDAANRRVCERCIVNRDAGSGRLTDALAAALQPHA